MPGEISEFIKDRQLDDAATKAAEEAFTKARHMLRERAQPPVFLEVLAKRIIYWATTGERDPDALARRALSALGYEPDQL
jgi:hypothetical protein